MDDHKNSWPMMYKQLTLASHNTYDSPLASVVFASS